MSDTTEETEEFTSLYTGTGKLNQQDCSFEVGQRPDGQIRVYCTFSESPKLINAHGVEWCGKTGDGRRVCGKGPFQNRPWDVDYDTEPVTHFSRYRMWELTVGEPDWNKAHSISFALTNFLFCGNEAQQCDRPFWKDTLSLKLDGLAVTFQKVSDYDAIYNSVIGAKQTEVTCKLTIEVAGRCCDEMRKMANRICDLLTIAQGRRIEWINYEVYDSKSSKVFTHHAARRTDRRNGFRLIDFRQANRAINYLERGYPAYIRFDMKYPTMLNGVASMITDSNSTRFTLTRALIMFSVVDALGKKLLEQTLISQGKPLRNSYPISDKISALKTSYKVCLSADEIDYFRESRNSVVHELKFHTKDTVREYERCFHIFHRLLLRILYYQSEYFDITLPGRFGFGINNLHPCP